VLRALVAAFALVYLLVRLPVFVGLAADARGRWEPVGVLWWRSTPPSDRAVQALVALALACGAAVTVGWRHRITGPLLAGTVLMLTTIRSSTGQLLWFENLMVLHLAIVGCSAAADAWSLDAARRRVAGCGRGVAGARYGEPIRLAAWATVLTYCLAGVAKLRNGGSAWLDGESLRRHIAYSATRLDVMGGDPSPLAAPLLELRWGLGPLAVATVVIELGAPLVLLLPRLRVPWVLLAWCMHAAIAATMFVVFPYPLALVAFAPLFRLERLPLVRRLSCDGNTLVETTGMTRARTGDASEDRTV